MKKIILLIVISTLLCGCLPETETPAILETVSATKTAKPTAEPTKAITATPTEKKTETATEALPTNEFEAYNIVFDTSAYASTEGAEARDGVKVLSGFDMGDGQTVSSSRHVSEAQDSEGNVFFLRYSRIYKAEASGGEVSVYKYSSDISEEYEFQALSQNTVYVGVVNIDGKIYGIISAEPDWFEYEYYLENLETGEISQNYLNNIKGYYGSKILDTIGYNEKHHRFDYRFYDVLEDKFYDINIDTLKNNFRVFADTAFATQDYVLLINYDKSYETEDNHIEEKNLYFINSETYELEAIYPLTKNGIEDPWIFDYKDGLLYLFLDEKGEILTLNPDTWELNRICDFEKQTMFTGYDINTQTLYLKQRYDYEHMDIEGEHYNNNCLSQDTWISHDIYFDFHLNDFTYEITDEVCLKDVIKDKITIMCVNDMRDYKVGEYIFNYYEDRYEGGFGYDYFNFILRRNGGEVYRDFE